MVLMGADMLTTEIKGGGGGGIDNLFPTLMFQFKGKVQHWSFWQKGMYEYAYSL